MSEIPLPRTGAPALRALASAGYTHLGQLNGVPMADVFALHGMGPKGIGALRRAMAEHNWAFADDDPAVGAVQGGRVSLTEGRQPDRNDSKTEPTSVDPIEWVASLPKPRQRDEGAQLIELFNEVTGAESVMWGPSIIGYGELHYVYESGREGDMPKVGFSPRSVAHTFYLSLDAPGATELLDRLGKHRTSVACLYVNKLADVDIEVLRELVKMSWEHETHTGAGN
ncbi:helix-hairpin-helix domain-containing protein [Gulosibacter macacae]|uniref:Helix-hairpin-helix domain-containing protein n=1 Tax=Gulosibacter macacae TaxID=2488791 RepID=A0A3P3VWN9_9MICO|nr:DUF1801 domain-containing protein [Gulosibacter macacae]RRJ86448.1 helix-hairpin-helix domain-containing protein [Gulosibacter macacae]